MKTITKVNSFKALAPVLTQTSIKPAYRPRYHKPEFILSEIQKRGVNRLLHGLRGYTDMELKALNEEDKRSIVYKTNLAWTLVNKLKQRRLNAFLNGILTAIVPNLVGNMVPFLKEDITDSNFIVDRNLKECEVPMQAIVEELILKKLLPANFLA